MSEEPREISEGDLLAEAPGATVADRWRLSGPVSEEESRSGAMTWWPVARVGLKLVMKRKIFKVFFGLGLMNFLFFSSMIYFLADLRKRGLPQGAIEFAERFAFTGKGEAYHTFIFAQNIVVMLLLAISGTVLVSNDFRFRSLTFYLSKPLGRGQYFLGKLAAISMLVGMLTLLPCLALFLEYGLFSESFDYFIESADIFFAILAYGLLVSVSMSVLLLGVAALLRRTISIVMVWGLIFVFLPRVTFLLRTVSDSDDSRYWGMFDFWTLLSQISKNFFGIVPAPGSSAGLLPLEAFGALVAWLSIALWAFWCKTRAVEVVS